MKKTQKLYQKFRQQLYSSDPLVNVNSRYAKTVAFRAPRVWKKKVLGHRKLSCTLDSHSIVRAHGKAKVLGHRSAVPQHPLNPN